ncbi:MAG: histidine kinase, partial [Flavobacteriales bacterium]|nr:histidine kinase [Flavobacteriales bacterium]
ETYSCFQDSHGYIWITTDRGIVKYDGNEMTLFTKKNGLVDNVIFGLFEDQHERLWTMAFNGELGFIKHDSAYVLNDKLNAKINSNLHARIPASMYIDSGDTIWVGLTGGGPTIRGGFYKVYDDTIVKFYRNGYENELGKKQYVGLKSGKGTTSLKIGREHKVIHRFPDGGYFTYSLRKVRPTDSTISYLKNAFNEFYPSPFIGLENIQSGKFGFCQHNDILLYYQHNTVFVQSADQVITKSFDKKILNAHFNKDGNLLLCFNKGGAHLYDGVDFNQEPVKVLEQKSVSNVCHDLQGNYWFTTLSDGVYKFPSLDFKYRLNGQGAADKITAVCFGDSNIWYGYTNKIARNDLNINEYQSINHPSGLDSKVSTFTILNGGAAIIGSSRGIHYLNEDGETTNLTGNRRIGINVAQWLNDSLLLMGSYSSLQVLNVNNLSFWSNDKMGEFSQRVFDTHTFKDSVTFLATHNGIWKWNTKSFEQVTLPELRNKQVIKIVAYKNQMILVTRENGLYLFNETRISQLKTELPLWGTFCNDVYVDSDQNIWYGSNHGVALYSENEHGKLAIKRVFDKSQGLLDDNVLSIDSDGKKLAVLSNLGVTIINLSKLSPPHNVPFYISALSVNQKKQNLKNSYNLSYDENNVSVQLEVLDFRNGGHSKLRYRLLALDSNWLSTTSREIRYTNLPSGAHTLQVQMQNSKDQWITSNQINLTLQIGTPIWRKWWVLSLLSLIVIFIIIQIVIVLQKRKHRKANKLAQVKRKIAEARLTALQSQMNPHFVFNALNSIQSFVLSNNSDEAYDYLTQFGGLMRLMLENSKSSKVSLEDEIETLTLYIQLEALRFNNGFEFSIEVADEITPELHKIPSMIIQPYVENAILHGLMRKEEGAQLKVIFSIEDNNIKCIVEDNGIGRKQAKEYAKHQIRRGAPTGMSNSSDRLNLLNERDGKTYSVAINDLYDSHQKPCGTRIIINL